MTEKKKPSLTDLIAKTPGAQSLQRARASIKARREKLLGAETTPPVDVAAAEPLPIVDAPDEFAKGFFQRLMHKQAPPRGSKPQLIIDNERRGTSHEDDDPEPPKAA